MKIFWSIILAAFTLSCSKSESRSEEVKTDPLEIIHKTGEGALLVGATVDGKLYNLLVAGNGKTISGSIVGRSSNESPVNCRLSKKSVVYKFNLPAGEYTLETISPNDGNKSRKTDVKIEEGKCVSINADGYAW